MKNSSRIAAGVAGAVAGYVATFVLFSLLDFGNRADPITSGLLGLFFYSPVGAIAGAMLASWLVTRSGRDAGNGSVARNSLKSLGIVVLLCAAGVGIYMAYAYATATPWLNPNANNPLLVFEVRFPAGVTVPASAQGITIELQTDLNTMPGEVTPAAFYRDGDQSVIAGEVELAFRTSHRQLAVTIQDQPSRIYPIDLTARAPHTPEFRTWRRLTDGSEIRYRAKWPGKT
ncbi:hypothetical protein [Bradyrhizobium japonicum]|uniref:hypothetical protein n=1 Tax=Bradyrhizobium japonicum TaxID=375 RepID=UPI000456D571|nr:hypothetical protein [Bradyrhizobium japonicum]AHY51377.1 hypothetical protein BJS_04229 [Bradyrhizobium japonicum SEMIA 5079]MCD9105228.1 hypothetical protein [Bradyrhizobium japonicum]MCD9254933.1 hypothetical protein [Bradyrhizobium japonicum SEMIA 5079]MCD9820107.1 hypothetical protein [Bradyrhizobium japonicum]MCD9892354.1 hypothetical protein [Bradyrhizobium japonicum]